MDKYCRMVAREYKVRSAGESTDMQPVAKAERVKRPAQHHFRLGIPPFDPRHVTAAGLG